jgi:hypothetical protein
VGGDSLSSGGDGVLRGGESSNGRIGFLNCLGPNVADVKTYPRGRTPQKQRLGWDFGLISHALTGWSNGGAMVQNFSKFIFISVLKY